MASASRVTVDELVALNDEMASLARTGVPLEHGLRLLSTDLPGRLGKLAGVLSERLERGQSLVQVLSESGDAFSPAYCAVVAAGLRSGRLAAALEGISTTARRVTELRRMLIAAMVYPLIVLAVASLLFAFTVSTTAPVVAAAYSMLDTPRPAWYEWSLTVADQIQRLLPWFWLVLLACVGIWLYCSARAVSWDSGGMKGLFSVARVLRLGRTATLVEILTLMVEQGVPLDEAVELSSAASGDASLRRSGQQLAESLRRGETGGKPPVGFPPFLGWLMLSGTRQQHLARALRQAGEGYRRKALRWGSWLGIYLPIFLSAGIGGGVVLLYVLLVLAPFYNLLYELGWH